MGKVQKHKQGRQKAGAFVQEAGRTDAVLAGFAIHGARRPPRACVHGRGRAPEVISCLGPSVAQAFAGSCCNGRARLHRPVLRAYKAQENSTSALVR